MRRAFLSCAAVMAFVAFSGTASAQYGQQPPPPPPPAYGQNPAPQQPAAQPDPAGWGTPAGTESYPAPEPAPQPAPSSVQPAQQPAYDPPPAPPAENGGAKPISGFLGPRLNVTIVPTDAEADSAASAESTMVLFVPEIEGGITIKDRVQIFMGFGVVANGFRATAEEDPDENDAKMRAGNLLLQLGARFNITKPQPGNAYLYTGIDFTWIIGFAKQDVGDEENQEAVDAEKEQIDRFGLGGLLGVEFLVTEHFGIGAESGLRLFINNLKKCLDEDTQDEMKRYRDMYLEVPFALRFMYHF